MDSFDSGKCLIMKVSCRLVYETGQFGGVEQDRIMQGSVGCRVTGWWFPGSKGRGSLLGGHCTVG